MKARKWLEIAEGCCLQDNAASRWLE